MLVARHRLQPPMGEMPPADAITRIIRCSNPTSGDLIWFILIADSRSLIAFSVTSLGFFVPNLQYLPAPSYDVVDQSVLLRLLGRHEPITIEVPIDLSDRLPGVLRLDLVEALAEVQDLLCLDLDVGRIALRTTGRLMKHDPGVGEGIALTFRTGRQKE